MSLNLTKLLTPKETAEILRVAVGSLAQARFHKRWPGLKWVRYGRAIRYRLDDVEKFIRSKSE
jgi:hypothetical protein